MTTRIWIEAVKRPDGSDWYTDRGLLLQTRLGGPDGEVLCDRVHNAIFETCRVFMSRHCRRLRDMEARSRLRVHERRHSLYSWIDGARAPDDGWSISRGGNPFDQNAVSRSAVLAPAREDDGAGRGSRRYGREGQQPGAVRNRDCWLVPRVAIST
jgi:hypothetical protein